jgi:hypothetical protein
LRKKLKIDHTYLEGSTLVAADRYKQNTMINLQRTRITSSH